MTDPEAGQTWKHYKGNTYYIMGTGRSAEDGARVVIYRDDETIWVRSYVSFMSLTTASTPRFIKISE